MRPSDPTRSGALWVGGAGVALLLAAAAVLTAVRWDDIGQSVKLGGLVAITAALLAAGQRFRGSIPMTAQAIFHLGALLIPFDMAAVAILAGRSWQETLLLTSVTSVVAWYGIERAVPSVVLRVAAGLGMVGTAAGLAAMTGIAMAPAMAVAAAVAVAVRKPTEAGVWALLAGLLPVGAFVPWPPRIAGAMHDLGFDDTDRWQPLIAGVLATLVLVAVTRLAQRVEVAWSAILVAVVTLLVSLGGFAEMQLTFIVLAAVFVGLELLAIATERDPLWRSVTPVLATIGELFAAATTALIFAAGVLASITTTIDAVVGYGVAASLLALGWLIADRRQLDNPDDWLTGLLFGSDWPLTTIMFPAAVLGAAFTFGAPWTVLAATALATAGWMIATWRTGSAYGAIALVALAALYGAQTGPWIELIIGAGGAGMLSFAARQRVRAQDHFAAIMSAFAAVLVWIVAAESLVRSHGTDWPLLIVLVGAWALSWALDVRTSQPPHVVHYVGRVSAAALVIASLWLEPAVGLAMCASVVLLAGIDYLRSVRSGAPVGSFALTGYALVAGAALGLSGAPVGALLNLSTASSGAALAVAGFVLVGIALVSPRVVELPLAAAALTASVLGVVLAFDAASMLAIALIAAGASLAFTAVALRDVVIGVAGYVICGLGVSLQLAVWNVTWLEPYLIFPAVAAMAIGYRFHRTGGSSWAAYAPTIALASYVSIAERLAGGPAWHAVIAGGIGVVAVIAGGYRKLVGPLVTGSIVLAVVVGYESLGPAALVPTWAWLAAGGAILLAAGVALERSDTTPLERGQQIRSVVATQFS